MLVLGLFKLPKMTLIAPASMACAECVFSKAGIILSNRRLRCSDKCFESQLFGNMNKRAVNTAAVRKRTFTVLSSKINRLVLVCVRLTRILENGPLNGIVTKKRDGCLPKKRQVRFQKRPITAVQYMLKRWSYCMYCKLHCGALYCFLNAHCSCHKFPIYLVIMYEGRNPICSSEVSSSWARSAPNVSTSKTANNQYFKSLPLIRSCTEIQLCNEKRTVILWKYDVIVVLFSFQSSFLCSCVRDAKV